MTLGPLRCDDGLVKTTKLNESKPDANKRQVPHRVYRAHANGTFKAPRAVLLRSSRLK
jgi:hypothetical protein